MSNSVHQVRVGEKRASLSHARPTARLQHDGESNDPDESAASPSGTAPHALHQRNTPDTSLLGAAQTAQKAQQAELGHLLANFMGPPPSTDADEDAAHSASRLELARSFLDAAAKLGISNRYELVRYCLRHADTDPGVEGKAPAERCRKVPLAALGGVFFNRAKFPANHASVDGYLRSLSLERQRALWGTDRLANLAASPDEADSSTQPAIQKKNVLAIYPGSFNPPTRAHTAIATIVAGMPEVRALWMDLTTPYRSKQKIAEVARERREMVEIVLRDLPNVGCSAFKEVMGPLGDTEAYFDTLRQFAGPGGRVAWVIGSDVVQAMKFWSDKAARLLRHVDMLIVFVRSVPNGSTNASADRQIELQETTQSCWKILEDLLGQNRSTLTTARKVVFRSIASELQPLSSSSALGLMNKALQHVSSDVLAYIAAHPALRQHYQIPR